MTGGVRLRLGLLQWCACCSVGFTCCQVIHDCCQGKGWVTLRLNFRL